MGKWNTIPYSAKEVYCFEKNGRDHTLVPAYKYRKYSIENNSRELIDLCLIEDFGAGYQFFQKIFNNVISTKSKDRMLSYLKDKRSELVGKSIYLVLDISAAGLLLNRIIEYAKYVRVKIYFCSAYESFEYLLLRSNFFCIERSEVWNQKLLEYLTVERKCTELLEELTAGKIYSYSKGKLSKCYYERCCSVERKEACSKGMSGDKITRMLENTEFKFLLDMRQVEED